jgi:hypothetical protein
MTHVVLNADAAAKLDSVRGRVELVAEVIAYLEKL